jgi:hypothetical protein
VHFAQVPEWRYSIPLKRNFHWTLVARASYCDSREETERRSVAKPKEK